MHGSTITKLLHQIPSNRMGFSSFWAVRRSFFVSFSVSLVGSSNSRIENCIPTIRMSSGLWMCFPTTRMYRKRSRKIKVVHHFTRSPSSPPQLREVCFPYDPQRMLRYRTLNFNGWTFAEYWSKCTVHEMTSQETVQRVQQTRKRFATSGNPGLNYCSIFIQKLIEKI